MKNRLLSFFVVFSLLLSFSTPIFADDFPVSVYGAPGEQKRVMEYIEKDEQISDYLTIADKQERFHIVEESIMPIYLADLLDYSQDGVFRTRRWENYYAAQFEREDGRFAGTVFLLVENSTVKIKSMSLAKEFQEALVPELGTNHSTSAPCSYSYHKEFIQKNFGDDIGETDVCYLMLEGEGCGFYVKGKNGNPDAIFYPYIDFQGNIKRSILWIDDKLKTYADEKRETYEKKLAEIEAWKAEHPGEDYPLPDGGVWEAMLQNKEKRSVLFPIIGASVLAGAGILAVILLAAKRRRRTS